MTLSKLPKIMKTVAFSRNPTHQLTCNFDIVHLWMNTECNIARQSPWSGRPRNQAHVRRFHQRKWDNH